jgi:GntR family transcriptional repressor for pyruvate dehydrogenase complex
LRGIVEEAYRHAGDPGVLDETDARFHVAVAEASRNLVLVRVMFALLDLLATSRRETLDIAGRARLSLDEHERIIEEIERRDPEAAREAMLSHLISVESAIRFSDRQRARQGSAPKTEE